jgi:hypothetical protein
MNYGYEQAGYRCRDMVLSMEDLLLSDKERPSGYVSPQNEENLPRQTLLIDRDKVKKLWR